MKVVAQAILICLILMMRAGEGYACDCAEQTVVKKFNKADAVFVGEIVEVSSNYGSYFIQSVKFKIEKQWKGKKANEIIVLVGIDIPGMCGDMPLNKGKRYLVYAYKDKKEKQLVTHADCGPNIEANHAGREIKLIECFYSGASCRIF